MRSVLLSGYNIHVGVDDGKLVVRDGRDWEKKPTEMIYKPKFVDFDQIVIYGHTGNVTLSALKWIMKHKVPIHVLDYDGTLLTTMNPPQSKTGFVKLAQYKAYNEQRIEIAKKFIHAKILRTKAMMDWLIARYPDISRYYDLCNFEKTLEDLKKVSTLREIMGIEGITARHYWDAIGTIFPEKFGFESRGFAKTPRPLNAIDPINALFNYGYSILEGLCRRAVNSANLDPYIGFLHETRVTKEPLVYDMQEPFRWIIDLTIIQALERKIFHKKDFIRTEDYIIRVRPDAVSKLMDEIDRSMSQTVIYKGLNQQWGSIIQLKAQELSNYVTGNRKTLDLSQPMLKLDRVDNKDIREKILSLSYVEWEKMGFSRGTLYYMKKNARGNKPFTLNSHVKERLEAM